MISIENLQKVYMHGIVASIRHLSQSQISITTLTAGNLQPPKLRFQYTISLSYISQAYFVVYWYQTSGQPHMLLCNFAWFKYLLPQIL